MAVITISREIYSEGSYIGEKVAETLGYHFVDKSTIEKIFVEHSILQFRDVYESGLGFWTRFDDMRATTVRFLKHVILALARHGDMVIVGRGAFAVLGRFADVLNVRVQAPFPIRVQRVMQREKITELDRAEAFLREKDRMRDTFVKSFYDIRWEDAATASAFDLVIDTGKVPPDLAATWLIEALKALKERKADDQPTTNSIDINTALASTVSEVLGCQITH
jgi:cytidylate kinase